MSEIIDNYQTLCSKTAIYPNLGKNFNYPLLGLGGEIGELIEKLEQIKQNNRFDVNEIIGELGDNLWYCAMCCFELSDNFKYYDIFTLEVPRTLSQLPILFGKMCNKFKKVQRDHEGILSDETKRFLLKHTMWIIHIIKSMCIDFKLDFEQVLQKNIDKLQDRMEKNKIKGEGDNR